MENITEGLIVVLATTTGKVVSKVSNADYQKLIENHCKDTCKDKYPGDLDYVQVTPDLQVVLIYATTSAKVETLQFYSIGLHRLYKDMRDIDCDIYVPLKIEKFKESQIRYTVRGALPEANYYN